MGTEIRRNGNNEPATTPRREEGYRIGGTPALVEYHSDRSPLRHQQATHLPARGGRDHRLEGQTQGSGEGGRVQAQGSRVGRLRRACTTIAASEGSRAGRTSCVPTGLHPSPARALIVLGGW